MSNRGSDTPPDLRLVSRVFSWKTLAATAVAVVVLAMAALRVFDIDWDEMWAKVRTVDLRAYLAALVLYYLSFWTRGIRWRLIARTARLDHEDGVTLPSSLKMGAIILMGWFANGVAFLRLGDAYRGFALHRESGASFASCLGTVVAERVQDMAAVLILLLVGAVGLLATGEVALPPVVLGAAVGLVMALVAAMVVMRLFGLRIAAKLPGRAQAIYGRFHAGTLGSFKAGALPPQLALGITGWLLEIGRFYFVAEGLGIEIGFFVVLSAALANAMLTTIPTPGGFGFVEGGLTGVLILLGESHTDAFTLTLVDRSISWVSIIIIGGTLFFIWQAVKARNVARRAGAVAAPAPEDVG
ncbi:MAG: lysylphosphatidylglycerol synthase transmembrane domain-containing protein [Chloroflexota bacterium]